MEAKSDLAGQFKLVVEGNVTMAEGSVVNVRTAGTQSRYCLG